MTLAQLRKEAKRRGVVLPHPTTLAKYGWDLHSWLTMLAGQGWVCPLCGRAPANGKFVTDHEHVRGWTRMPPEVRRLYVRGITCWIDNRYLLAGKMDRQRAENAVEYFRRYERRRPG